MKPAPISATWIGRPSASRARSAVSTRIMPRPPPAPGRAIRALISSSDLRERRPGGVLLGDLGGLQRPAQAEVGIERRQAALLVGRVELADLVGRLGAVLEHLVAVREALGHVQRAAVLRAQLDRDVLEERRALRAQVDDDVDDRAARGAHELRLRRGRELEVHPAQRALVLVERGVGLGDHGLEPVLLELVLAERAREVAAVVRRGARGRG